MRLNKFIAEQLAVGRRQADYCIEKGRVRVNGQPAILGQQVNPATDTVVCDGQTLKAGATLQYVMLNKPAGYVCSRKQQGDTPTIYSLLPAKYHHLKPVGRLDKDSSGLLLLTNDGDFAHRMTHPSFAKVKKYQVTLDKELTPEDLHKANKGVQLEDGVSKLAVRPISHSQTPNPQYEVTMHEGRNRQIRRTFDALGYKVTRLHRTAFSSYKLNSLAIGVFIESYTR